MRKENKRREPIVTFKEVICNMDIALEHIDYDGYFGNIVLSWRIDPKGRIPKRDIESNLLISKFDNGRAVPFKMQLNDINIDSILAVSLMKVAGFNISVVDDDGVDFKIGNMEKSFSSIAKWLVEEAPKEFWELVNIVDKGEIKNGDEVWELYLSKLKMKTDDISDSLNKIEAIESIIEYSYDLIKYVLKKDITKLERMMKTDPFLA